ncbi:MAG: hypothetical protein N3F66_12180 [Spirochaetes bacterium]|nr:hypothetical protein [Spirochaetota bacterium]
MNSTIFQKLEQSYADRVKNHALFKDAWSVFINEFPPTHCLLDFKELPSTSIALNSGDLGFALLWIVQSVLIRCILFNVNQLQPWDIPVQTTTIGAMAHTEPDNNRMIVRYSDAHTLILSGHKRYISGGSDADIILLTARRPGDEKYSKLIYIPVTSLPQNVLQDINLSILPTIKHSSLTLSSFTCPTSQCCPVKDKELRKILKKWSLIERALIGEAYIAFLCYLAKHIPLPNQQQLLEESLNLLSLQKDFSRQQIENAFADKFIDTLGDVARVLNITQTLANFCMEKPDMLQESITLRANDLNLFNKIRL